MDIKLELFSRAVSDAVYSAMQNICIDTKDMVCSDALAALDEIKGVIQNQELDDFEVVEEIVCIFETYNIDAGGRHDF